MQPYKCPRQIFLQLPPEEGRVFFNLRTFPNKRDPHHTLQAATPYHNILQTKVPFSLEAVNISHFTPTPAMTEQ